MTSKITLSGDTSFSFDFSDSSDMHDISVFLTSDVIVPSLVVIITSISAMSSRVLVSTLDSSSDNSSASSDGSISAFCVCAFGLVSFFNNTAFSASSVVREPFTLVKAVGSSGCILAESESEISHSSLDNSFTTFLDEVSYSDDSFSLRPDTDDSASFVVSLTNSGTAFENSNSLSSGFPDGSSSSSFDDGVPVNSESNSEFSFIGYVTFLDTASVVSVTTASSGTVSEIYKKISASTVSIADTAIVVSRSSIARGKSFFEVLSVVL